MEIRKLTEPDYDQVLELYVALDELHAQARPDCCVCRDKNETYPRDAYTENLARPDDFELGAFEGGQLVGIVRATLWNESGMVKGLKVVCLDDIYVLPACHRRGIAAKLFAEVEAWAREQEAVRLDVYTWAFNKGAIAMYETMGMTPQQYVFEKKL